MANLEVIVNDKRKAEELAYEFIRDKYGNIPYPGEPVKNDKHWSVPINAKYPRIIVDDIENKPKKIRFIKLDNLGTITISEMGQILDKPKFYEISKQLSDTLNKIRDSVEKALVKVGSKSFSHVTFAEHIYTPICDILSQLLDEEKIDLEGGYIPKNDMEKYMNYIDILNKIGLTRVTDNNIVLPGDKLVEIEVMANEERKKLSEKLEMALTVFFCDGFEWIDRIRSVLGPHLTIAGFCYQQAYQYGAVIPFKTNTFRHVIAENYNYNSNKLAKVSRYLIQLENVGLITEREKSGERMWSADSDIFDKLMHEEEILEPISSLIQ